MTSNRNFQAMLARARAGTMLQIMYVSGTSHAQGAETQAKSWPGELAPLLTAETGINFTDNMFVGSQGNVEAGVTPRDPRIVQSAGWSANYVQAGSAGLRALTAGVYRSFTPTGLTDTAAYLFRRRGGSFGIDAGGAQIGATVVTTGADFSLMPVVTRSAALAANTWKVTNLNNTEGMIAAAYFYDSTTPTIIIMNGGSFGKKSTDMIMPGYADIPLALLPGVCSFDCITNDVADLTDTATYQANLRTMIANFRQAGMRSDIFMLTNPPSDPTYQGSTTGLTVANQKIYTELARAIALEQDVAVLDVFAKLGEDIAAPRASGLYVDSTEPLHLGGDGNYYGTTRDYAAMLLGRPLTVG